MAEIMTAREAVERYIKTGTQVCWGGFSYTRRPYTIAREVIRQRDRIQHHFCTMNGPAPTPLFPKSAPAAVMAVGEPM